MSDEDFEDLEGPDLPIDPDEGYTDRGPAYGRPVDQDLPARSFKGWHRPRKQLVRNTQWLVSVRSLLDKLSAVSPHQKVINYIGLPGSDLIDVRMFAQECASRGKVLRYLGFDRSAGDGSVESIYLNLSREELRRSGAVHRDSVVMPDELATLSDEYSPGYQAANDTSFDIINLDLCGSVTNERAGELGTLYDSLSGLLHIQAKRSEPWILLLTGTFDREGQSIAGKANAAGIAKALQKDLTECNASIAAIAESVLGLTRDGGVPDLKNCDEDFFARLLVSGFVNWISRIGKQHRAGKYRFVSAICYRLNKDRPAPDMYSLAIHVQPKPPHVVDPAQLLPARPIADDCEELRQQILRMTRLRNVDEELARDDDLYESVRIEMADLLAALRYDRALYLDSDFSLRIDDTADRGRPSFA